MESTSSLLYNTGKVCRATLVSVTSGRSEREKPAWAAELLARFDFWADEAGLFAPQKQSLDHQLRSNAKVRAMVQQFLEAISADAGLYNESRGDQEFSEFLRDASIPALSIQDAGDEEMPNSDEILSRIEDTIARLIRLSRQMRQHVRRKVDVEADQYDPKDHNGKPLVLEFESHVRWKLETHPSWRRIDNGVIKDRLQKTMLLRWRRVFFHSTRAEAKAVAPNIPNIPGKSSEQVLQALEAPRIVLADLEENRAVVQPETTNEGAKQESLLSDRITIGPSFKPLGDSESIVSSRRTKSLAGVKAIDVPKAPPIPLGHSRFMCPFCSTLQPLTERERKTWQLHVLRDLAPYVCLYEDCSSPDTIYRTSKEWLLHMAAMHDDHVWLCRMCDREFQNENAYREHVVDPQTHHSAPPAGKQKIVRPLGFGSQTDNVLLSAPWAPDLSSEELAMLVRMNVHVVPKRILACFFCATTAAEVDDLFMHMAEHLRYFALDSIPWHVIASESDGNSQSAHVEERSRACDSSLARMEQYIDDVPLPFDRDGDEHFAMENSWSFSDIKRWPKLSDQDRNSEIARWALQNQNPTVADNGRSVFGNIYGNNSPDQNHQNLTVGGNERAVFGNMYGNDHFPFSNITSPSSALEERSPFRYGSPLAPGQDARNSRHMGTQAAMRQQKNEEMAQAERARHESQLQQEPSDTIEPKVVFSDWVEET